MKNTDRHKKQDKLIRRLTEYKTLAVAFSGGVDSTYLLAMARIILGDAVIAVTADSEIFPSREKSDAAAMAEHLGARHIIMPFHELNDPEFSANHRNRCYVCKKHLLDGIIRIATAEGIHAVVHGANRDDSEDFRPGMTAARELGVAAPLMDAGMTKKDIRCLSEEMNLPTWKKPAMACLASRIPYYVPISSEILGRVDQAENVLVDMGFSSCRVRYHGSVARIEVPLADVRRLMHHAVRVDILTRLKQIGFAYIAVDLEGYVQGSMNRPDDLFQSKTM